MEKNDILKNALLDAKTELNTTYLDGFLIDVADLVFEERVKMNCYYCGRYNSNWKCPPKLPDIDYPKMFQEFDYCAVVYVKVPFDKDTYADIRNESSLLLHKALLQLEIYMSLLYLLSTITVIRNGSFYLLVEM